MAGLIPRTFIDDLLNRTDIVDIVDSRVKLKKAGKNYQACCPFHTEKSPSFTVSPDKQFYHCFGCGAHGNAISFVMEYERLDFVDAIEELAAHLNLEVPREQQKLSAQAQQAQQKAYQQKQDDYQLMEKIAKFFQYQLKHAENSAEVIHYLKTRGLSGEIAKKFAIGYSLASWDSVVSYFGKSSAQIQQLIDLGMAIKGEKPRPYDRFRDRVMFPIRDKRGRVIGFGGRVLADDTPKYLNSPETRIYHKGQELYGLYEAKQANKQLTRLVIVEGYMDVVALAQHGVENAVASLGTATTSEQLQTLFRTVNEVICCYDGDRAGYDAAWRAMENALPLIDDSHSLKFIFMPEGEDPDTFVRQQGASAFEQLLDSAQPLSQFLFDRLLANHDINTLEGKAAITNVFQPYLQKLPESTLKQAIITQLANQFGTGSEQQLQQLTQQTQQLTQNNQQPQQKAVKATPVRMAIALLLSYPQIIAQLDTNIEVLKKLEVPGISLLIQLFQLCQQQPEITAAQIIEYFRGQAEAEQLAKLLCWQHHVAEEAAEEVFLDSLEKLLNQYLESRTENLLQKARLNQLTDVEKQELQQLLNH